MRFPLPLFRPLAVLALMLAPALSHAATRTDDPLADPEPRAGMVPGDVGRPADADGDIPYVIVTDRTLAPIFIRLAQAHERDGLTARIRTVQSIHDAYPNGRDDAERIRMFLQDAHAHWGTEWVLLGADDPLVPVRRALLRTGPWFGDVLLPTDQYYACLDGTWNANGDDNWGELSNAPDEPGDDVDLIPELNIGRAPVTTRQEARGFVDKTVREMDRDASGAPLSVLLAANDLSDPASSVDLARVTERMVPLFSTTPPPQFTRLYQNVDAWPGALPLSRSSLLEALDRGPDVAVLAGPGGGPGTYGQPFGLFQAGPGAENLVSYEDMLALTNRRPSHVYVMSAFTNAPGAVSIGAGLMRAPGGAVTVIGSTLGQIVGLDGYLAENFLEQVYGESRPTIGEALREAIVQMSANQPIVVDVARLTTQGNLLLGDPALVFPMSGAGPHDRRPGVRANTGTEPDALTLALGIPTAHPNPASEATRLDFSVPAAADGRSLAITIVDVSGRRVRTLARGAARTGAASVTWDLRDDAGGRVGAGLYFARIATGAEVRVCRVAVTR
jgi:hypothetical protein